MLVVKAVPVVVPQTASRPASSSHVAIGPTPMDVSPSTNPTGESRDAPETRSKALTPDPPRPSTTGTDMDTSETPNVRRSAVSERNHEEVLAALVADRVNKSTTIEWDRDSNDDPEDVKWLSKKTINILRHKGNTTDGWMIWDYVF